MCGISRTSGYPESVFSEQVANFHAWSGAISCHDSLNLRKEVALPINYEGTLSSCSDKPGSIASASEALSPLVGYRLGTSGRVGL